MIERDPWQPKLWCGTYDRHEPSERALAETLVSDEEDEEVEIAEPPEQ